MRTEQRQPGRSAVHRHLHRRVNIFVGAALGNRAEMGEGGLPAGFQRPQLKGGLFSDRG